MNTTPPAASQLHEVPLHEVNPAPGSPMMTTVPSTLPLYQQPIATGYLDKPADRRLRPWIIIGSLLLACIAAGMIITTFISYGTISHLWGIFIAGCALGFAAIIGLIAGFTLRPGPSALFFFVLFLALAGSFAVLIVNACFLHHYMNKQCASFYCREYYTGVYTAWGVVTAVYVPTLLIAAGYLWRTTRIHRTAYNNTTAANNGTTYPYASNLHGARADKTTLGTPYPVQQQVPVGYGRR